MSKLKAAIARGAEVEELPNLVEITGLEEAIIKLEKISVGYQASYTQQTKLLMASIDRLVDIISKKEMTNKGTDLSELVKAVSNLKQEIIVHPNPHDWEVGFERDRNTGLVKSPYKLTSTPRILDS